ncbi:phosphate-starvation-inducible PsiE family protein [Pseudomonas sp. 18.1.10]|uniref:phosphate-starvation-inducible PsiE family protein n=1 Tax=Pseudomonas sp. 18.1.10 TaxID=2969302 RepID=UPI00215027C9|nr:phosphate-starvation-inducible PsiE family protein [Pseudomonas sp. 18.1.10]MCR4536783.1 phosphate-starvation-inducible PsiE family protein [Pseudomonas sp. 18.1.10]
MSAYERFEQLVVLALSLIIALVIVIAVLQLCRNVVPLLIGGAIDPLDHNAFQALFGSIFTVLIALEFKHSIVRPALRRNSVVQVRTVLMIALLALSRKFVILDSGVTPASTIAALGFATLVLGLLCSLLRHRDLSE